MKSKPMYLLPREQSISISEELVRITSKCLNTLTKMEINLSGFYGGQYDGHNKTVHFNPFATGNLPAFSY